MADTIGKIPEITSKQKALEEILFIAKDKRGHIMMEDCISWLELKMKVIRKIARMGLKVSS